MTEAITGLLKGLGEDTNGNLLNSLMKVAGSQGGLGELLQKLIGGGGGAGLAQKAQSWISTGPNEDADEDELEEAFGSDTVAEVALNSGMTHNEAKSGLAALLPTLVDKLSPDGTMPDLSQLSKLAEGFLGGDTGQSSGGGLANLAQILKDRLPGGKS